MAGGYFTYTRIVWFLYDVAEYLALQVKNGFIAQKDRIEKANNDLILEEPHTLWVISVNYLAMLSSWGTFGVATAFYFGKVHISVATVSVGSILGILWVLVGVFLARAITECGTELWHSRIYSLSKWVVIMVSWDVKFEVLSLKHMVTYLFFFFLWDRSIVWKAILPISYSVFVMTMVSIFGANFDNYDTVNSFQGSFIMPIILERYKDPILRVLTKVPEEHRKWSPALLVAYAFPIVFGYYVRFAPVLNFRQPLAAQAPAAQAQAAQAQAQAPAQAPAQAQAQAQIELQIQGAGAP